MANPQHKTCLSVLRSVIGSTAGNEARFAEKIGRSTSWLKKASCGQIPLTENIALRISHETGISMRWLMQGDTSKTPVDKDDNTFTKATYENYRSPDYFPGKHCQCEARCSYECGCDADWTPTEVYKLREDAKQLADRLTALELHSTSELARLERERNESQEKYATEATEHMLAINKICGERDEARDALMKIEDLFIDGTDIYADRENMGLIARAALEETK
jgi:hypothetical protein